MRAFASILLTVVVVGAVGWLICRLLNFNPHQTGMLAAAGVCLLASITALIPARLTRGAGTAATAQAVLVGSILHLLTAIAGGALIYGVLRSDPALLYWLLAFYWTTLAVLSAIGVRAVKAAGSVKS